MESRDQLLEKGIALYHEGELHESARWLEACVRECRGVPGDETELLAMSNLSEAYMRLGRVVDAEHTSLALLALARQRGSQKNEVRAVGRLAMALLAQEMSSRWPDLRRQLLAAVAMAREIKLTYWTIQNLETLGCFAVRVGEVDDGFEWLQMALNAIDDNEIEADFFRIRIYCGIAEVMLKATRPLRAREYADLAEMTAFNVGSRHLVALSQLCQARIKLALDEPQEALQQALKVRVAAARENWKIEQLSAEKLLIQSFEKLTRFEDARDAAHRALALTDEAGMKEEIPVRLIDLGRICKTVGENAEAERYLRRASVMADALGRLDLASRAKLEMSNLRNRKRYGGTSPGPDANDANEALR